MSSITKLVRAAIPSVSDVPVTAINFASNAGIFAMETDVSNNALKTNTMTMACVAHVIRHVMAVQVQEIT